MTLEQLRIFVTVAELAHMTRAAAALHMTQSAVSAAIAALEARHGVRLFERVGRNLELSAAGREFLPEAKAVLVSAKAAVAALDDLADLKRGSLSLAASQTVASYWLPPYLACFAEAHPGIDVGMVAGNTAQVAAAILAGAADLGFVEGVVDHDALDRKPLAEDRVSIFGAPDHVLTHMPPGPADLKAARWVMRESGSGTRSHFEQALHALGVSFADLTIVLELRSNEAVLAAVCGSNLLTAVSDLAAAPLWRAGRVARLDLSLAPRQFWLLVHRQRHLSRAALAFLRELGEAQLPSSSSPCAFGGGPPSL